MGILSIFGYDRKSQDAYVDQTKLNRDLALVDANKIDQASKLILGQIPGIQAGASLVFAAGNEAAAIGRANAANILAETGEWARRRTGAQKAEQSSNRARAAASGIRLDTGGSSDIYQAAVKDEHANEISWGWKAGKSQAAIATQEGRVAQLQAHAQGQGILATIPGIQSEAARFGVEASALRQSANLSVAEARANRASARSGAVLSGITTIIAAIATYGAATAWSAGATTAAKVGAGALAIGAGGLALSSIFGNKGSSTQPSELFSPTNINTSVAGVNVGGTFNTGALPAPKSFDPAGLPSQQAASATTKRQYAGQQSKAKQTELNIFGGTNNPLAVGA